MGVRLHDPRPIAALEEMSDPGVTSVEGLRIDAVQLAHPAREVR